MSAYEPESALRRLPSTDLTRHEGKAPLVSIVMPAYNAEATIRGAITALLAQQSPWPREIIIVDDGSTDRTAELVSSFRGVRVLHQPNGGPALARNAGAAAARGDVLAFIDSDCEAAPNWLDHIVSPLEDPDVTAVKGAYRTRQRALPARFVQLEYEDKYDRLSRRGSIDFVDAYSAAFRRGAFEAAGGYSSAFPTACAEDVDLSFRMEHAGARMVFQPQAVVYHRHPERFRTYLRKKFRFASWRVLAVKRTPAKLVADDHTPQLMKVQAVAAPLLLVLATLTPVVPGAGLSALVLGSAFLASTAPFTIKALRKDRAVAFVSPLVLFLRGLAQGAGLIAGTARLLRPERRASETGALDRSLT